MKRPDEGVALSGVRLLAWWIGFGLIPVALISGGMFCFCVALEGLWDLAYAGAALVVIGLMILHSLFEMDRRWRKQRRSESR